ncbi:hypothetical protein [uncultured Cardiobacterium sp.]|uniref:phage tail terminator protein n=1 Tax=uncultured Cardiobacterium sp. TaxID=417619 RepID=UPI0026051FCC|nr:hypothetical protein [uncultured Cardiobacterium sp.]
MPTSIFDVNAAYAPIAERLKTVDGVRAVCGANDLAQVINGKTTGTDGYVYLIFDGIAPRGEAGNGRHQQITVTYSVIVASQNYQRDGMPEGVGELIGGVMQAMAGFAPLDDDPRSRQTLHMVPGERAVYAYGLSLYPLKYQLYLNFQSKE